jgi:hypothetical protein
MSLTLLAGELSTAASGAMLTCKTRIEEASCTQATM